MLFLPDKGSWPLSPEEELYFQLRERLIQDEAFREMLIRVDTAVRMRIKEDAPRMQEKVRAVLKKRMEERTSN